MDPTSDDEDVYRWFGGGGYGGFVCACGANHTKAGKIWLRTDALRTGKGPRGGKDYACTVISPSMNEEEQYHITFLWEDHGFAWLIALYCMV